MSVVHLDGPWRQDMRRESKMLTMGLLLGEVCSAMHVSMTSATVPLQGLLQLVTERTRVEGAQGTLVKGQSSQTHGWQTDALAIFTSSLI